MRHQLFLANTLSVGIAYDALVEYMLEQNEDIGVATGTVNPVVCECNDGYLNDDKRKTCKREHVFQSIKNAGIVLKRAV